MRGREIYSMKKIKHVCCKCESDNIDVMSVREEIIEVEGKQIATASITYICTDCGSVEVEDHYLYKMHSCQLVAD